MGPLDRDECRWPGGHHLSRRGVDDLKLARRLTNNTWDKIVIDADGAGMWSSLAIDSNARIAYFNGAADLRYAIN